MSGGLYSTEGRDFDQTLDLKKIKPYGDTMNDGKTQLSFTLPVPAGDEAIEAAKQLMIAISMCRKWNRPSGIWERPISLSGNISVGKLW